MRKLIFLFVCLLCCVAAGAQDIIVKKDGKTIQARVTRVTTSEVKYREFSKPNGLLLSLPTSELLAINYEDGEVLRFENEATVPTSGSPSEQPVTIPTSQRQVSDAELKRIYEELYKKPQVQEVAQTFVPQVPTIDPQAAYYKKIAKRWKVAGIITGGLFTVAGITCAVIADMDGWDNQLFGAGMGLVGTGLVTGTTCYLIGHKYSKRSKQLIKSTSLYDTEFRFKNGSSLNLGVDMISDNTPFNKTLGLGCRYKF